MAANSMRASQPLYAQQTVSGPYSSGGYTQQATYGGVSSPSSHYATTTATPTATYSSNQRYQPEGCAPVNSFSYNIPTLYSPAQVPTFEARVNVKIPVERYRNWWTEATTAERTYLN